MSENKIEISVKDIPEIIEQLKDLEKELEFERKSKNLFINDLYKVCEMSLKLQNQLQQKENIIKEVREKVDSFDVFKEFTFPLMKRDEEQQVKSSIDYEWRKLVKKPILEILDKEVS